MMQVVHCLSNLQKHLHLRVVVKGLVLIIQHLGDDGEDEEEEEIGIVVIEKGDEEKRPYVIERVPFAQLHDDAHVLLVRQNSPL